MVASATGRRNIAFIVALAAWGTLKSLYGGILTVLASVYLISLYIFTIWLVVGSLSAIQVRDDLPDDWHGLVCWCRGSNNRIDLKAEEMRKALYAADKVRAKGEQVQDLCTASAAGSRLQIFGPTANADIVDSDQFQKLIRNCGSSTSHPVDG